MRLKRRKLDGDYPSDDKQFKESSPKNHNEKEMVCHLNPPAIGLPDHDDANYDSCSVLLSPIIDQAPLPYIPGLTDTRKANTTKKRITQERFHKNVS